MLTFDLFPFRMKSSSMLKLASLALRVAALLLRRYKALDVTMKFLSY
jgi:hypothetical protein